MIKSARQIVRACLPASVVERYRARKLARRARTLSALAVRAATPEARWAAICGFDEFRSYQNRSELLAFLERVATLRPTAICEIGAASGGTLCALSHTAAESAMVISVDIDFTVARLKAVPSLARPDQTVACIDGDSHDPAVHSRVTSALGGRMLDLLFIDGDHCYSSVKADFEMYRGLVRPRRSHWLPRHHSRLQDAVRHANAGRFGEVCRPSGRSSSASTAKPKKLSSPQIRTVTASGC